MEKTEWPFWLTQYICLQDWDGWWAILHGDRGETEAVTELTVLFSASPVDCGMGWDPAVEGLKCGLNYLNWAESRELSSAAHTIHGDSLSWGFALLAGSWLCSWPQWVWLDPKMHKLFIVGGPLGKLQFGINRGVSLEKFSCHDWSQWRAEGKTMVVSSRNCFPEPQHESGSGNHSVRAQP